MTRTKLLPAAWLLSLLLLYGAVWAWYGGRGTPLTPDEGRALLERVRARLAATGSAGEHPEFRTNVEDLIARDDGREFYMVNLETLRRGPEAEAADAAYARAIVPLLLARGSFPVLAGTRKGPLLGDLGRGVDRAALVRYRSLRDFLDMNADPAMADAVPHKWASLEHTEVFPIAPFVSVVTVRLTAGLALALVAAAGLWLLGRRGAARENA